VLASPAADAASRTPAARTAVSSRSELRENAQEVRPANGGHGRGRAAVRGSTRVSASGGGAAMTGSIHIADDRGDTTRTWDTADPATVREIEEVFRQAETSGRLVYRRTGDGTGEQVTLTTWRPEEDTELVVAPRLAGG
jgi:hypothetical protein